MDKRHLALYNLESLAITHPGEMQQLFSKYGHANTPVNSETIAAMVMKYKEAFTSDVFNATRSFLNNSKLLNYDGADYKDPDSRSEFQRGLDTLARIVFGVNKLANPDSEDPNTPKEASETENKPFLGIPNWAWVLIAITMVMTIVYFVYGRNKG